MWRDLRYGFRRLASRKLFAVSVILLLAMGIGSNAVIFGFLNSLLLKTLPVRHPENLYLLQQMRARQVRPDTAFFYRQFQSIQQDHRMFQAAIAEQGWAGNSFQALSLNDGAHLVSTQIVSPNYFSELGVKAIAGRALEGADASAFGRVPVVLSEQCWKREFRRDPHILNRVIRIRNAPFLVVGVLPGGFHGIDADRVPDVRLPLSAAPLLTGSSVSEPGGDYPVQFQILARLAPGIGPAAAASALTPVLTQSEEPLWRAWYARSSQPFPPSELPEELAYWRSYRVSLLSAARGVSRLREQFSNAVILLMAGAGLLLLVVCANIAGLVLANSAERKREIGIRLSLGASRWRLIRQLYAENLLLAIPGAAAGCLFALGASPWLMSALPSLGVGPYSPPPALNAQPDGRVFAFVIAASVLALALFGLLPVRHAWLRRDLNPQLTAGGRNVSSVSGHGLIAFQMGLAVLLATASLLVSKTFWILHDLNPGFDQNHVIEAVVDPWDAGFSEHDATALLTGVKDRLAQLPTVRAVSFAGSELMRGIGTKTTIVPAGGHLSKTTFLNTSFNRVTPEYFESLGIPLLAGRNLNAHDAGAKPARIVVNRAFSDRFFPGQSPLGRAIVQGVDGTKPPTAVIVGLVGTAKYRSMREVDPPIYYAAVDMAHAGGAIYVRTRGDPTPVIRAVRLVFRKLAPTLPIATIYTLRQEVAASLWQERLIAFLCAFFGCVALVLSAVGVYSALSFSVIRRRREVAVRLAVGAQAADIVRAVSAPLAIATALGVAGGLAASALLLRLIKSLLFQVAPLDAAAFAGAAALLLVCAVAAAAIPTWRALQIEPSAALREE